MSKGHQSRHQVRDNLVPDPWGREAGNPFSTPWFPVSGQSPRGEGTRLSIKSGELIQYSSPWLKGFDLIQAQGIYRLFCNVMNGCTEVRRNWDHQSAQKIIPLFRATLDLAKVVGDAKKKERRVVDEWWNELEPAQKQAMKNIQTFLQNIWPESKQREFKERHKKGFRTRYFAYKKQDHIIDDYIEGPNRTGVLYFSGVAINPDRKMAIIDDFKAADAMTTRRRNKSRSARYAYWHVVLETANIFVHLDDGNVSLPNHLPALVRDFRTLRAPLNNLRKKLEKKSLGLAAHVADIVDTLDKSFECFDAKKDRNLEFAQLDFDARQAVYKKRNKAYDSKHPKRPSEQATFGSLMEASV